MKLRLILLVFSLLSFLSASAGGYLYYTSLREDIRQEGVTVLIVEQNTRQT